tara:strand:- start:1564 stop:2079 length:516 start_codon:yes stop_codon:yes gene_type:complete
MIYEPREDSFLLLEYVKEYSKGKVLDLGCGSGILSKGALEETKDVLGVDINEEAVDYCKNQGINAIKSDLFENVKNKFDLIIFNPPYLPLDKNEDKDTRLLTTGGKKGDEIIGRFLKEAKNYLEDNGNILILFSSLSGDILNLFKKYNYKFKLLKEKKLFFEMLYVYELTL